MTNFFGQKLKEFYPTNWQFGFQEPVTPVMEGIIRFHHDLFFFLTIILIFVCYLLIRCLLQFEQSRNPEPIIVTHAPTLEIVWTLIPAAILFVIAIPSFSLLYSMDYLPSPFLTFKVIGHQWYWSYEFVNPNFIEETNEMEDSSWQVKYLEPYNDLQEILDEVVTIEKIETQGQKESSVAFLTESGELSLEKINKLLEKFETKSKTNLPQETFNELVKVITKLDSPSYEDFVNNFKKNHELAKGNKWTQEEKNEFNKISKAYKEDKELEDLSTWLARKQFETPEEFKAWVEEIKQNGNSKTSNWVQNYDWPEMSEGLRYFSLNRERLTGEELENMRKESGRLLTNEDQVELNNYKKYMNINSNLESFIEKYKEHLDPTFIEALRDLSQYVSVSSGAPQFTPRTIDIKINSNLIKYLYQHGYEKEAKNFIEILRDINFIYNEGFVPDKPVNPFNKDNQKYILDHVQEWKFNDFKTQDYTYNIYGLKARDGRKPTINEGNDVLVQKIFESCQQELADHGSAFSKNKTEFSAVEDALNDLLDKDIKNFHKNYNFREVLPISKIENNKDFEQNSSLFQKLHEFWNQRLISNIVKDLNADETEQFNQNTKNEENTVSGYHLYDIDNAIQTMDTLTDIGSSAKSESNESIITYDSYMLSEDDISNDAERLLKVDNPLYLPTRQHIRLLVTSSDVLHSWAVPNLGIKIDACPGRLNQTTTYIYRSGIYFGQCSEICGINHGFMPINVHAIDLGVESDADDFSLNAAKYIFKMLIVQMFA